jgi:hypothetical protein
VIPPTHDNRTGQWLSGSQSRTLTWLRFTFPEVILPFEIESASLTLRISAPSRLVEIVGWSGEREVTLASHRSPMGVVTVEIDKADVLNLDDRDGLLLGIVVNAMEGPSTGAAWQITGLELDAAGRTLER